MYYAARVDPLWDAYEETMTRGASVFQVPYLFD